MTKRSKKYNKLIRQNKKPNYVNYPATSNFPLFQRIINMIQRCAIILRQHLLWTIASFIVAALVGFITFLSWYDSEKAKKATVAVTISGIEIPNETSTTVFYMLPPDLKSGNQSKGILPISLINRYEYNIENFKFWVETNAIAEEKSIIELNTQGKFVEKQRKTIKQPRFFNNIESEFSEENDDDISRHCTLFTDLIRERIEYKIPHFNSLFVYNILEKFKIQDSIESIDGYTAMGSFEFPVKLTHSFKNNQTIYSSNLHIFSCKKSTLEEMIDICKTTGLFGGGLAYNYLTHPKTINIIAIYPYYYYENNELQIDIKNTEIYSITYYLGSFFRKRQIIIKDNNGNILSVHKFKDSKEIKEKIRKIYGRSKTKDPVYL